MTPMERFQAKVDTAGPVAKHRPDLGRCHLWTAATIKGTGYGGFQSDGKMHRAHRWLWQQVNGPLLPTQPLDHFACDNPPCVNLDHMRPVTTRENVLRSETSRAAVNLARTECEHGHPLSGENLIIDPRTGWRACRECGRRRSRDYARKKRAQKVASG